MLLADDHEVVRLGLHTLIDDQPQMEVVGEAGTTQEALMAVERLRPDVVLMDVRMPGEGVDRGHSPDSDGTIRKPGLSC